MAITLESISSAKAYRAPRIVLLGVEKIGKTTFAAGSSNPVLIPVKGEEGADEFEIPKFPTIRKYGEIIEALGVLYNDEHKHETVIIDSASTLEPLVWAETCQQNGGVESIEKVGGGYGKGYNEALKYWREIMDGLDALREHKNMASIIIGHVAKRDEEDPLAGTYRAYEFDIHKKATAALFRWADCILFANTKTIIRAEDAGFNKTNKRGVGTDERVLFTQKRPAHPGGGRGVYGRIPYELPLSWSSFENAVAAAQDKPAVGAA